MAKTGQKERLLSELVNNYVMPDFDLVPRRRDEMTPFLACLS